MTLLRINDFPQLSLIAWNRDRMAYIEEGEAFDLYESCWRWIEQDTLEDQERELINRLVREYGRGVMNV